MGFIRNLPKDLFAAFRATFEEAADADLLLHVVDASDPAQDEHVRTVKRVLEELDLGEIPRLLVFNKIDLVEPAELRALERSRPDAAFVSATHRETTRPLIERIAARARGQVGAQRQGAERRARIPRALGGGSPPGDSAEAEEDAMTTVDDMLRAAGKRVRPRRAARSRSVA